MRPLRQDRFPYFIAAGLTGLAVLLAGCGTPTAAPATGSPAAPATTSPAATAAPASDWTSYTTTDGDLTFDHPADWNITDRSSEAASGGMFVEVTGNGRTIAALNTNVITGAECMAEQPYSALDSQPLPALAQDGSTPRFVFEGRMDPTATDPAKMNILAYGITSAPEPTGPTACPIYHFFTWPPSGAAFAGTYDPFAPGGEPHVDTPHAYMETQEYQDIRRMITSLRPAG
jgi:hypothetical protein